MKKIEENKNKRWKERMQEKYKTTMRWLCGLWALGLGSRLTLELLLSDGWIHIPKHPLNIWFDFLPLCLFGLFVVIFETREMTKYLNKSAAVDNKKSRRALDEIVTKLIKRREGSYLPVGIKE